MMPAQMGLGGRDKTQTGQLAARAEVVPGQGQTGPPEGRMQEPGDRDGAEGILSRVHGPERAGRVAEQVWLSFSWSVLE